jgi:hypothetical protein
MCSSVNVFRKGMGDMAVSNSIGSNVFDIWFGLGFPWLLKTIIAPDRPIFVNSNTLTLSVMILFITVAMVVLTIHAHGWVLQKRICYILLSGYLVSRRHRSFYTYRPPCYAARTDLAHALYTLLTRCSHDSITVGVHSVCCAPGELHHQHKLRRPHGSLAHFCSVSSSKVLL